MKNIVEMRANQTFTRDEAAKVLPIVYRITEEANNKVKILANRIEAYCNKNHPHVAPIESEISKIFECWQAKLRKLGIQPKGMWLADFDSGEGYFCWKYPEVEINYWHGYQDGFSGRIFIE